jgi:hypothetical protein
VSPAHNLLRIVLKSSCVLFANLLLFSFIPIFTDYRLKSDSRYNLLELWQETNLVTPNGHKTISTLGTQQVAINDLKMHQMEVGMSRIGDETPLKAKAQTIPTIVHI